MVIRGGSLPVSRGLLDFLTYGPFPSFSKSIMRSLNMDLTINCDINIMGVGKEEENQSPHLPRQGVNKLDK